VVDTPGIGVPFSPAIAGRSPRPTVLVIVIADVIAIVIFLRSLLRSLVLVLYIIDFLSKISSLPPCCFPRFRA
jgi:hypothetical protein